MRVVLVAIHPYPSPQAVPLGNAYLQSYLATYPGVAGIDVRRGDCFLDQSVPECTAAILALQPDLVGFSLYVWNRSRCLEIAEEVRQQMPGIRLFAGGPEATADPGGVLAAGGFDFLIAGEGETPFAAVCQRLLQGRNVEGIPGVATLGKSGISLLPAQPLGNLDEIPSPWLNGTLDVGLYPGILWQLSRGCGFTCDFCFDSRGQHGVRRFSMERIESELRLFAARGVSQIFVLDSTFNQDQRRAKTILRMIRKIAPGIHFHFEVRSEFIDREMAELFAAITCSLQIGLQSSDPRVLKQVGRAFRPDDFVSRIMQLNDTGAVFGFDLMYGLPGDSLTGFRNSLEFALDLYPNHLDIFPLAILPGTALAQRAEDLGLNHLPHPPYVLLSSPTFPASDMEQARRLATACDIFYTRGRAVAWFNGVRDVLRLGSAEFLHQFGEWLEAQEGNLGDEAAWSDQRIWELQRGFLMGRCTGKKLQRFLPAALDLVDYHYHYAAALLSAPQRPVKQKSNRIRLLQTPLRLAGSLRLARFHYEILEVLEGGAVDVRAISDSLQQSGSWAVIYPTTTGVCTESIDEGYFKLLHSLDGNRTAAEAAAHCGVEEADACEFIEFALAEGIVTPLTS